MTQTAKDFLQMTAADLMHADPVTIKTTESMQSAAELLSKRQLSGVPVIDDNGRCVGVLSATDFVQWMDRTKPETPPIADPFYRIERPGRVPLEPVSEWMTADPVTVSRERNVADIARMMLVAHIHRVIVVDNDDRPVGIVTTTNILSAVAYLGRDA